MDATDPEVKRVLEDSLKNLVWMRAETKNRQQQLVQIEKRLQAAYAAQKINRTKYQEKLQELESARIDIHETLKMIQRQRTLIISWLRDAEA